MQFTLKAFIALAMTFSAASQAAAAPIADSQALQALGVGNGLPVVGPLLAPVLGGLGDYNIDLSF
ncbi:hypothetical protein CPC08DRAFT_762596 [Agrocybe pediades]|nr:hypothetical protein CPC08DRAFT_762596 [Agrocybe pediades]